MTNKETIYNLAQVIAQQNQINNSLNKEMERREEEISQVKELWHSPESIPKDSSIVLLIADVNTGQQYLILYSGPYTPGDNAVVIAWCHESDLIKYFF